MIYIIYLIFVTFKPFSTGNWIAWFYSIEEVVNNGICTDEPKHYGHLLNREAGGQQ